MHFYAHFLIIVIFVYLFAIAFASFFFNFHRTLGIETSFGTRVASLFRPGIFAFADSHAQQRKRGEAERFLQ